MCDTLFCVQILANVMFLFVILKFNETVLFYISGCLLHCMLLYFIDMYTFVSFLFKYCVMLYCMLFHDIPLLQCNNLLLCSYVQADCSLYLHGSGNK